MCFTLHIPTKNLMREYFVDGGILIQLKFRFDVATELYRLRSCLPLFYLLPDFYCRLTFFMCLFRPIINVLLHYNVIKH